MVSIVVEMIKMEIVEKKGTSCRRLVEIRISSFVPPSKIFVWVG